MNNINLKEMDSKLKAQQQYLRAQKRVKQIKGFYTHLIVYILVNIFISGTIIFGMTQSGESFKEISNNFGVYSTWIFWGIGLFFHWLGVFGFSMLGFGKDWEDRKIKELMNKNNDPFNK